MQGLLQRQGRTYGLVPAHTKLSISREIAPVRSVISKAKRIEAERCSFEYETRDTYTANSTEPTISPVTNSEEQFSWARQWYPLIPISYADPSRPLAVSVLGKKLVLWFHSPTGSWRCFQDRCPHRMAPLSEGRIESTTGNLMCSYHGWQFDNNGSCTSIPQTETTEQGALAMKSPRSCVASYPVKVEQGLLWAWLQSGPDAIHESNSCGVALPTELRSQSGLLAGDWYMRELPVSYKYLLENLLDPSHVHFAHHGIIGSRDRAAPLFVEQQGELTTNGGFSLRMQKKGMVGGLPSNTYFIPPSLTWLQIGGDSNEDNKTTFQSSFSLIFYAVPVGPQRSRIIAGYSISTAPALVKQLINSGALTPLLHAFQWLGDLGQHEVIDGDTLFLRYQEEIDAAGGNQWGSSYFLPTRADLGVVLLRKWFQEKAGGGPSYGPDVAATQALPLLTRNQVLDRYEQHTKICPYCSKAFRSVKSAREVVSLVSSSTLTAGLVLATLQGLSSSSLFPPRLPMPFPPLARPNMAMTLLSSGLLMAILNRSLRQLEERFSFKDYTHYNK